jgi:hypothetical protein
MFILNNEWQSLSIQNCQIRVPAFLSSKERTWYCSSTFISPSKGHPSYQDIFQTHSGFKMLLNCTPQTRRDSYKATFSLQKRGLTTGGLRYYVTLDKKKLRKSCLKLLIYKTTLIKLYSSGASMNKDILIIFLIL